MTQPTPNRAAQRHTRPDRCPRLPRRSGPEGGYAILLILFLVALLAIAVAAASLNVVTNTRREKEEEMIWRGRQYVRGIRLYYGKLHRFPTALDDLYKPKTGIRFMRQAYKDPMNKEDGSWRAIYVGPNGQLIGSLKDRSVNLGGQPVAGFGGAAGPSPFGGQSGASQNGSTSMFGSANGFGSASSFSSSNGGPQAAGGNPANGLSPVNDAATTGDEALQAQSLSDSPIIGGNIIGVGSKINKKSIIWFEKAKNYRQYEFIWDPSVDSLTGQRPGLPSNTAGSILGTSSPPAGTATPGQTASPEPGANPNPNPDPTLNPPLQAPPNP